MSDLSKRRFPPLPDMDADTYGDMEPPHPDGRAWGKACPECTSDPQKIGYSYQKWIATGIHGHAFYCVHRSDDGCHRVCACYAALHPEQATSVESPDV